MAERAGDSGAGDRRPGVEAAPQPAQGDEPRRADQGRGKERAAVVGQADDQPEEGRTDAAGEIEEEGERADGVAALGFRGIVNDGGEERREEERLADAQEAERTIRQLVSHDHVSAEYTVSRWDADKQEWVDPTDGDVVPDDAPETAAPDPSYVILEAYKPRFLRDLGL